jgi:hypothetical protein
MAMQFVCPNISKQDEGAAAGNGFHPLAVIFIALSYGVQNYPYRLCPV